MEYKRGFKDNCKQILQSKYSRVYRGEIYLAEMEGIGSIQNGIRPVVIIQNDLGNKFSPTTIVVSITSQEKTPLITHMAINLTKPSTILCEQIHTINKFQLKHKMGELNEAQKKNLNEKLKRSLGISWIT